MNLPSEPTLNDELSYPPSTWGIAFAYVVVAGLWITLSDGWVEALWPDAAQRALAQTVKGWAFVIVTAGLLLVLLRRRVRREQRSTESATRAREQALTLLQAIADNSPDAIFVKDREGRYRLFNREAARVTGTPADKALGEDDTTIFSPEEALTIRSNDERVMALGRPETFEEEVDTVDGRVTFLATKGPLHDEDGNVVGMFGISRDITALRSAQRRIEESELKYRFMFEASPLPMWAFDRDTLRYVAVNEAALAHYGYTREEFLAMTIIDLRPPQERDKLRAAIAQGLLERKFALGETRAWVHQAKDGRLFDVEVASSDVQFDGHRARLMVIRDVTERRELERQRAKAMAEVEAARDLLNHVLERVDDGFVALDKDWHYTYVNLKAAQLFGRDSPAELVGRHIWTEFPEGVGQPFHRAYLEAMRTQNAVHFEEFYEPWQRWFENRVYPSAEGLSIYFTDITDRKQADEVLRHREREFRELADQMPAIIYRAAVDGSGRTLYISPFVERLGRTPEQWMADDDSWVTTVHPDDLERARAERRAGLKCGGDFSIEYRMRDAYGGWRHIRDTARYVKPQGGNEPYLQGVAIDVTDQVQALAALHASESRLRLSERRYRLAAVQERVWEWDVERGVQYLGAVLWEELGISVPPRGTEFRAILDRLPQEDAERLRRALVRHLRDREPYDLEFQARAADGTLHWFHTQGQAVWDGNGRAVYMAGTTIGIDARRQAEEALRESEAYRRSLFEQLADGVLLLDQRHRIIDANPRALALIGRDAASVRTLLLDDLLSEHDRSRVDDDLVRMLSGQVRLLEWDLHCLDGSRVPVEVSVQAMDGERIVAVLRDVSARREAERALLAYQLELSELAQRLLVQEKVTTQRIAQVLHDHLGQTLAVARLNLDAAVAAHGDDMSQGLKERCGQVSRLVDQAVRETRQILADLRPPMLSEQGLAAALDNEIRQRLPATGTADVLLEVDDPLERVRWPQDVEYGAFMIAREAVANALQHAHAGLIRVVLSGSPQVFTLEVVDDGAGIPVSLRDGRPGHLGLVGMRERAIAIGARLEVVQPEGGGTCVRLMWEG